MAIKSLMECSICFMWRSRQGCVITMLFSAFPPEDTPESEHGFQPTHSEIVNLWCGLRGSERAKGLSYSLLPLGL